MAPGPLPPTPASEPLRAALVLIAALGTGCALRHEIWAPADVAPPPDVGAPADVPSPRDVPPSEDAATTPDAWADVLPDAGPADYRTVPDHTWDGPWHGSDEGSDFGHVCADDELMVGLVGRTGGIGNSLVNALGVRCAPLRRDGTLGPARTLGPSGGAGRAFEDNCPMGDVLVRLVGRAGDTLDRVGGTCAPLALWLADGTLGAALPARGGDGGRAFEDTCPAGFAAQGLEGGTARFLLETRVRRVRVRCVRVQH